MDDFIFDAHNHLGSVRGRTRTAGELIDELDSTNVQRAVAFSVVENIDNDLVARAAAAHPDRLVPFAVINPWRDDAEDELRRCFDLGFAGLKLHPVRHGYPLDRHSLVDPLLSLCAERAAPVIAFGGHDYFSTPDRFESLARAFPDLPLIMAHMGFVMERDAAHRACSRYPNIYLETSGVATLRYITGAVEKAGAGKVIFGSNSPHSDIAEALETVRAAVPDPADRRLVLGANLATLLRLSVPEGVRA
jgi:predicted TIM-barrel fold metal-dependent hydrolase